MSSPTPTSSPAPTAPVRELHARVDLSVADLLANLAVPLTCGLGCSACCRDDITVFEVEAALIRAHAPEVLSEAPHPDGACAFLDAAGACRVYPWRPYVCRTQGLPLRWLDELEGQWVEYRDICELNTSQVDVVALAPEHCWSLGDTEGELATLQLVASGNLKRVALRDLFRGS